MSRPTDLERMMFDAIRLDDNVALVATTFDGEPTSVIVYLIPTDDGGADVKPLAVLVTEAMFARLGDPSQDHL